jgi:hypothetical protein
MSRRLSALLLIVACGCGSPTSTPAPSLAPCERYVENAMRLRGPTLVEGAAPDQQVWWATRVSFAILDACVDDRWPGAAVRCGATAADEPALASCPQPPAASQRRLGAALRSLAEQMSTRAEAAPSRPETGIAECDELQTVFQAYAACDRVPEQARAAMRDSMVAMAESWKQLRHPEAPAEARRAAAEACRQATQALLDSAQALGCRPLRR